MGVPSTGPAPLPETLAPPARNGRVVVHDHCSAIVFDHPDPFQMLILAPGTWRPCRLSATDLHSRSKITTESASLRRLQVPGSRCLNSLPRWHYQRDLVLLVNDNLITSKSSSHSQSSSASPSDSQLTAPRQSLCTNKLFWKQIIHSIDASWTSTCPFSTVFRHCKHGKRCDRMNIMARTGLGGEVARSTARASGFDGCMTLFKL